MPIFFRFIWFCTLCLREVTINNIIGVFYSHLDERESMKFFNYINKKISLLAIIGLVATSVPTGVDAAPIEQETIISESSEESVEPVDVESVALEDLSMDCDETEISNDSYSSDIENGIIKDVNIIENEDESAEGINTESESEAEKESLVMIDSEEETIEESAELTEDSEDILTDEAIEEEIEGIAEESRQAASVINVRTDITKSGDTEVAVMDFLGNVEDGHVKDKTKNLEFVLSYNGIPGELDKDFGSEYKITEVSYTVGGSTVSHSLRAFGTDKVYAINSANLTGDIDIKVTATKICRIYVEAVRKTGEDPIDFNLNRVNITVKRNGAIVEPVEKSAEASKPYCYGYEALEGDKIDLSVSAKSNCTLRKATLFVESSESGSAVSIKKDVASKSIAHITEETTLMIDATTAYKGAVIKQYNEEYSPKPWIDISTGAKTVVVEPRFTYGFVALNGDSTTKNIGKIAFTTSVAEDVASISSKVVDGITYPVINLTERAGGKTLKVRIYDTDETRILDTITFKVLPVISKVTVSGTKSKTVDGVKVLTLSQAVGATKSYKLTPDKASSKDKLVLSTNELEALSLEFDGGKVRIDGRKLYITTGAKAYGLDIPVTIYNESAGYKPVAKFTLKTQSPSWTKSAVTVKSAGTSDTNISVKLSVPSGVSQGDLDNGGYYYHIKITALEPEMSYVIEEKELYVKADTAKNQYETVKVIDREEGNGKKASFRVEATLAYMDDADFYEIIGGKPHLKNLTNKEYEEKIIVKSKTGVIKSISTKTPAYEQKLKIKKTGKKIYTGQIGTVVATVDYSDSTTHKEVLSISSITSEFGNNILDKEMSAYVDNDQIIVEPYTWQPDGDGYTTKPCKPGKYKIEVTYDRSKAGLSKLTASFDITILNGINSIEISAPLKVYKQSGKKATFKPTIKEYNKVSIHEESTGMPDVKKVEWSLDPLALADGITINKNTGVVTIPAKYNVSSETDDYIFVYAKAAGYSRQTDIIESKKIYITNSKCEISSLKLAGLRTTLKDNDSTDQKDYYEVKAYYDKEMTNRSLIDSNLYTVKVSGVLAMENGKITFTKAGTGTVTVTAKDGGGSSAKIKVKAFYSTNAISVLSYNIDAMPTDKSSPTYEKDREAAMYGMIMAAGTREYVNYFMPDEAIAVSAMNVNDLMNISISIAGGQALYKLSSGIVFVPTAYRTTVTLKDNATAQKYVIKFVNHAFYSGLKDISVCDPAHMSAGIKKTKDRPTMFLTAKGLTPDKTYKVVVSYPNSEYHPLKNYNGESRTTSNNTVVIEKHSTSLENGDVVIILDLARYKSGDYYITDYTAGLYGLKLQLYERMDDGRYIPATKIYNLKLEVY